MGSDLFNVSEEIVVITGAAGQLGSQYCRAFLEEGARVAGLDINKSLKIDELKADFPGLFSYFEASILERRELEQVLGEMEKNYGTPSVLVNNAALDTPPDASPSDNGPFEEYPDSSWDRVMEVNVKGVYLCCKVFGSAMARKGRGSIINISSIYGIVAPDQSLYEYRRLRGENFYKPISYSVSKSALLNLTRYLAVYWAKQGVRVNTLVLAGVFNKQDKEFLAGYCARIPIGRMAEPSEYNGAVLFLASRASSYMTGSIMTLDGGWTAI